MREDSSTPAGETNMDTSLRPMSTSQVLDRTFFLYRNNFVLFAGIALVTPTLTLIAELVQLGESGMPANPNRAGVDPGAASQIMQGYILRAVVAGIIGLIIYTIGYGYYHRRDDTGRIYAASWPDHDHSRVLPAGETDLGTPDPAGASDIPDRIRSANGLLCPAHDRWLITGNSGLRRHRERRNVAYAAGLGLGVLVVFVAMLAGMVWLVIAYCRYALAVPACAIEGLPVKYAIIRS